VTRPPRILQANRVVAHASYLRSFKPFHTTSAPSSPQAQQPASSQQQQPRPLQRSAFDSTQLGVGACSPSCVLTHQTPSPHPNQQRCTLPDSSSTADHALSPSNNCDPLPDSKSPPVLRRSSPQTKRWLRSRTLNLNSLPSPVPRETATLRLPAGDWTQLHCSRECCSLVREVSSANRDACALCTEIW